MAKIAAGSQQCTHLHKDTYLYSEIYIYTFCYYMSIHVACNCTWYVHSVITWIIKFTTWHMHTHTYTHVCSIYTIALMYLCVSIALLPLAFGNKMFVTPLPRHTLFLCCALWLHYNCVCVCLLHATIAGKQQHSTCNMPHAMFILLYVFQVIFISKFLFYFLHSLSCQPCAGTFSAFSCQTSTLRHMFTLFFI